MKNIHSFFARTLCAFVIWGCSSKLEDPDLVPPDQQLQLSTGRSSIKAGGVDTTLVVARVPLNAGKIDVTFTTTAGTFLVSAAKTIKQQTDSIVGEYRYASTVLKSDTSHGTVYITAETGAVVRKRTTLSFTN